MTNEEKLQLCKQIHNGISVLAATATAITDEQALSMASLFPEWKAGTDYAKGQIVIRNGQLYCIAQAVTSIESQLPESEGMLAIYRPIDVGHEGTLEDPIPFVYGMNTTAGLYYSYNEKIYKCTQDMIPCVWVPGTIGAWWEEVA